MRAPREMNVSLSALFVLMFAMSFVQNAKANSQCAGDVTNDGIVDSSDIAAVLGDFGCMGVGCVGDLNGDGVVDTNDLSLVLSNFGCSGPVCFESDLFECEPGDCPTDQILSLCVPSLDLAQIDYDNVALFSTRLDIQIMGGVVPFEERGSWFEFSFIQVDLASQCFDLMDVMCGETLPASCPQTGNHSGWVEVVFERVDFTLPASSPAAWLMFIGNTCGVQPCSKICWPGKRLPSGALDPCFLTANCAAFEIVCGDECLECTEKFTAITNVCIEFVTD